MYYVLEYANALLYALNDLKEAVSQTRAIPPLSVFCDDGYKTFSQDTDDNYLKLYNNKLPEVYLASRNILWRDLAAEVCKAPESSEYTILKGDWEGAVPPKYSGISFIQTDGNQTFSGAMNKADQAADNKISSAASDYKHQSNDGVDDVVKDVLKHDTEDANIRAIETLISMVVTKMAYTGLCLRDYTANCPVKWEDAEDEGICYPEPNSYAGDCAPFKYKDVEFDAMKKEDLAWKCMVEWPCRTPPAYITDPGLDDADDLYNCPYKWRSVDDLCICGGPVKLDVLARGCSPVMDFRGWDEAAKLLWAHDCHQLWRFNNVHPTKSPPLTLVKDTGNTGKEAGSYYRGAVNADGKVHEFAKGINWGSLGLLGNQDSS